MIGIIAAAITGFTGFIIHLLLISNGFVKINPDWCIKKLKRHAQLLLAIWVLLIPVFYSIFVNISQRSPIDVTAIDTNPVLGYFYGIFFFLMFFFVYLTFYYVVDRSVSSRIMIEIERSPNKRLTYAEIMKVYDMDTKYKNETQGMVEGGFVKFDGKYYSNTPKGLAVAMVTAYYKKLFRLGKGG